MDAVSVPIIYASSSLTPDEMRKQILHKLNSPTVFKGILEKYWTEPLTWSPQVISQKLSNVHTKFKICPKATTVQYEELCSSTGVVYETDCQYIHASFGEFKDWLLQGNDEPPSKKSRAETQCMNLSSISRSTHWIYADYKYMNELCSEHPDIIKSIDWSVFGFESRNGNQSTLWIGSEGACTPCHYDTYGCNLVAQLWGTKEWILYSPTDNLYPTRIPYEESSVFSSVNLRKPWIDKYPLFLKAIPHKVILHPGDVLFVPHHWWHYVECIEPSVSVNTWLDMPQDNEERIKEAVVRTLVSSVIAPDQITSLVNPNEVIFPFEDNLELLSMTLSNSQNLSTTDFINAITSNKVIDEIVNKLQGNVPIQ